MFVDVNESKKPFEKLSSVLVVHHLVHHWPWMLTNATLPVQRGNDRVTVVFVARPTSVPTSELPSRQSLRSVAPTVQITT